MIVIKFGGSVLNELHPSIIDDILQISQKEKLVLVHGGGNEVTNVATKLERNRNLSFLPAV